MTGKTLFRSCFYFYLLGTLPFLIYIFLPKKILITIGKYVTGFAFLLQTVYLISRGIESGRVPFSNQFEFMIWFSWGIILAYFIIERLSSINLLGIFITPLNLIFVFWAVRIYQEIKPLVPALQSIWLNIHVAMAVIAYGGFAVSFVLGIFYLLKEKLAGSRWASILEMIPNLNDIDNLIYKTIAFSFPFLTLVIIFGAVWAEEAWGAYWSWDPKEVWSLITWLIYIVYFHFRYYLGAKRKRLMVYISIFGFLAIIFTFVGVNYLLSGLHSYR